MTVNTLAVKFWVVSGSYNGGITFSLFECQDAFKQKDTSLRPLKKFYTTAHAGPVRTIALSDTAELCVSGGADETIRFFDLVTLETDGVLPVGNQGAVSLEFVSLKCDPNRKPRKVDDTVYVQSCTTDGDVCLWNLQTKDAVHQTKYKPRNSQGKIMKKRSPVANLCVHPTDPSISAVTYLDGSVQLWALDDKYAKSVLWATDKSVEGSYDRIMCCRWACGGNVCIMQSPRSTFIVQIASGEVLKINPSSKGDKYTALAVLNDKIYLGTSSGIVYVYNLTSIHGDSDLNPNMNEGDDEAHIFADLWIELCPPDAKKLKSLDVMEIGENAILVTGDADGNTRFWKIGESETDCELLHSESTSIVATTLKIKRVPD